MRKICVQPGSAGVSYDASHKGSILRQNNISHNIIVTRSTRIPTNTRSPNGWWPNIQRYVPQARVLKRPGSSVYIVPLELEGAKLPLHKVAVYLLYIYLYIFYICARQIRLMD